MDTGLIIGIIGLVITIASFIYAIVVTKRSRKTKDLKYDILPPAPIAGAISKESGYSIRLVYETPNKSSKTVDSVFVQYVRFTNFGESPIRKDDSANADPLRVEVEGDKVLDITLANVTREVCQISLGTTAQVDEKTVAKIHFDFLDFLDGGLIQIVTEGENTRASLLGTLIGMPQGIKQGRNEKTSITFPDLGCVIPIIIQVAVLIAVPFIYRQLTGGWENVWLLLLPVAALVLPLALTIPLLICSVAKIAGRVGAWVSDGGRR